ncbi:MAG: DNA-protecting protein DprA, partial [Caldimonas sp.]
MIDRDELAAWVRLLETPGVGRDSARKLLAAFGSPQAALDASVSARNQVVPAAQAGALAGSSEALDALLAATLAWIDEATSETRDVVTLGDPRYP